MLVLVVDLNFRVGTGKRGEEGAARSRGVREIDGGGRFAAVKRRRNLLNGSGVVNFRGIQRGTAESGVAGTGGATEERNGLLEVGDGGVGDGLAIGVEIGRGRVGE